MKGEFSSAGLTALKPSTPRFSTRCNQSTAGENSHATGPHQQGVFSPNLTKVVLSKGFHDMDISRVMLWFCPSPQNGFGLVRAAGRCSHALLCLSCLKAGQMDRCSAFCLSTEHRPIQWSDTRDAETEKACPTSKWEKRASGTEMNREGFVQYCSHHCAKLETPTQTAGPRLCINSSNMLNSQGAFHTSAQKAK